ncbi:MAG: hypothetical protein JSS72_06575 [Armatimonadetes bacterium]|nr:hypothetical protein [Armatimonadota bacterium]
MNPTMLVLAVPPLIVWAVLYLSLNRVQTKLNELEANINHTAGSMASKPESTK